MAHLVVVTGLSGAGRSTALHVLEDLGFYCVDNLPPALAPRLVELAGEGEELERLGLGVDVRTGSFLVGVDDTLDSLEDAGHEVEVVFLDCADDVLIRRYSETRRPHPLAPGGDVPAAIQAERTRLGPLRARAATVIDTSDLTVHDLKRALVDYLSRGGEGRQMVTRVISFGFKYGLPKDADLVFDLRYLPNPHHVRELRPKTGLDEPVARYVLDTPEAAELLDDLERLLAHTLPRYEREGKAYLTIAIGCTGGRHRSVAMSEALAARLRGASGDAREVRVQHRDVDRATPRPASR
ncbi:MAG TPA: RNase adapter RapZ [Polyangiaceae bacterium LLY-WYZ-15_(1-7)]|nr:RNase adapter RapZ [Polyangiaceae bacterium LLY-WYZ-15_(1-7)]HJL05776.1 RNase adapter RapZ [Polyangiaceae bacterium LLY-WYZ-15_(1-7)]HJL11615.1 RNase adapter RapZ [Polyangiaceae bacterium LLY-WYZ-15_(1-7)]HJL37929.1 RNase adapter RapZ [Polyangiaceae bacterium LLY-WYZ-15_(1-7)]HJL44248.1 RNase adapter RapZ [Polyangiaceae bacterium LLY-WYZ-15_(1-7)]